MGPEYGGKGRPRGARPTSAILAISDLGGPLILALMLLIVILRGSDETCERIFRLLR